MTPTCKYYRSRFVCFFIDRDKSFYDNGEEKEKCMIIRCIQDFFSAFFSCKMFGFLTVQFLAQYISQFYETVFKIKWLKSYTCYKKNE